VLLSAVPDADLVDIAHDIPPHDVDTARLTLARIWRGFPASTVHLVVVDPGVGSARVAVAVASEGRFLVGPDNGVLSPALFDSARVVALPVSSRASPTFHGRDVFAPAAAALARGAAIESLGAEHRNPIRRCTPEPTRRSDGSIVGEIIAIDRFGNAVTNLTARDTGAIDLGDLTLPICRVYADVDVGGPLALVGSSGLIEIAVREGSAAAHLGAKRGDRVVLRPAAG